MVSRMKNAWEFLTILPFPFKTSGTTGEELGRSMVFFPLIGLLLGGILALLAYLLHFVLPWVPLCMLIIVANAYITGGIHLDGVADTLDGLTGGRDRKSALLIMRDSRIGSMGTIGIIFMVLMKFAGLASLTVQQWPAIVLMPLWGRYTQLFMAWKCPYARSSDGIGKPFTEFVTLKDFLLGSFTMIIPALIFLGIEGVIPILAVSICTLLGCLYFDKKLGGITGDVLGGMSEVTEVLGLYVTLTII